MPRGFWRLARTRYAMRCTSTLVLPEPGPASTSTFVASRLSATSPRWRGLDRLSTIDCHDSGVVSRSISARRPDSQRRTNSSSPKVKLVEREAHGVSHAVKALLGVGGHHMDLPDGSAVVVRQFGEVRLAEAA